MSDEPRALSHGLNPYVIGWWTEQRVKTLRELWDDGLSATEIAEKMEAPSRSAILGKVHRLKLPGRLDDRPAPRKRRKHPLPKEPAPSIEPVSSPIKSKLVKPQPTADEAEKREKARATAMANITERMALDASRASTGVSILDLESHHCRWPLSEEVKPIQAFRFCGATRVQDCGSYCAEHYRRSLPGSPPICEAVE